MKILIIVCAFAALLYVAFIHARNSLSQDEKTLKADSIFINKKQTGETHIFANGGQPVWVKHYASGLFPAPDVASAIAVDGAGNVYVTGASFAAVTHFDYITIKYDASGVEQWVARYDGLENAPDSAIAIAVDGAGNVYVTGKSWSSSSSFDYATVKYNTSGSQEWVARYNGLGNRDDMATTISLDGSGNVYVTGHSAISINAFEYATIKYSADGVELWVAHYNGQGESDARATDLVVDGSENVYVTGWAQSAGTSYDYVTIKYNPSGVQEWIARYNGPINGYDFANALAVDSLGNVYVTGGSSGLDYSGDYATVKYDSHGVEQWVARYNTGTIASPDNAIDIAVDGAGNVYVTGTGAYLVIRPDRYNTNYVTIKYNSSGSQQWIASYEGLAHDLDYATKLALDRYGNVYVTGSSAGTGASSDYTTIKYNSSGDRQWVTQYDGVGSAADVAADLTVDGSGNIYVTGKSKNTTAESSYDCATVKYNSSGIQQWVARYNGPANAEDYPYDVAVDALGNVYVTGWSKSATAETSFDYATIKYTSAGVQQWVARYNGPANAEDFAHALTTDGLGNVYVIGSSAGLGTSTDYATIKYDSSGIQQWVVRYNGLGNASDWISAIAVDAIGNVYVTGSSFGAGTDYDYATIKYDSSGALQWVVRYNGPENSFDQPIALAIDERNIYVTGDVGLYRNQDIVTIKYNSSGVQEWITRYDGPRNSDDHAAALVLGELGNVYVAGTSNIDSPPSIYHRSVYTTIKYAQTSVSVEEKTPRQPSQYRLLQNYPNPFNPATTIRYAIAKPGHVTLKVFNLQGQEIATLVNENKAAGEYEIQWNPNNVPSGVYVYRLQAGDFVVSKKFIILR